MLRGTLRAQGRGESAPSFNDVLEVGDPVHRADEEEEKVEEEEEKEEDDDEEEEVVVLQRPRPEGEHEPVVCAAVHHRLAVRDPCFNVCQNVATCMTVYAQC